MCARAFSIHMYLNMTLHTHMHIEENNFVHPLSSSPLGEGMLFECLTIKIAHFVKIGDHETDASTIESRQVLYLEVHLLSLKFSTYPYPIEFNFPMESYQMNLE